MSILYGMWRQRTCLQGFWQSEITTSLLSYRDYLENWNFVHNKLRHDTFQEANNKDPDHSAWMHRLVCAFDIRKPKEGFSSVEAYIMNVLIHSPTSKDHTNKWAVTWDFQQCGILTSVDSDKPVQPPFKLRNSKWCLVSSLTVIGYLSDYQRLWSVCAYAQAGLSLCWSHKPHCWKSHVTAQITSKCRQTDRWQIEGRRGYL